MARYGVIADIHGNKEALCAAVAALEARHVDRFVCLGDIVGYNADPDECAEIVRQRCAISIMGNHELIALGLLDFSRCTKQAEHALRRTRKTLSRGTAHWLSRLPPHHRLEDDVVLVHGGVRDVLQYMTSPAHIAENASYFAEDFPGARVCFFGHSHEQRVYAVDAEGVRELPADSPVFLLPDRTYFVNPGSIDAQRKSRHKLAEFAIFDTSTGYLEFNRVRYHAAATEAKAATFGYRLTPMTDRLYTWKRRLQKQGQTTVSVARRAGTRGLSAISGLISTRRNPA
jgi:predicted phosphodiesterase